MDGDQGEEGLEDPKLSMAEISCQRVRLVLDRRTFRQDIFVKTHQQVVLEPREDLVASMFQK